MRTHSQQIRRETKLHVDVENERRRDRGEPPLSPSEREAIESRILRRHLLCNLGDVEPHLAGLSLPPCGFPLVAERQTDLPDDTPATPVEAVLDVLTNPGDPVLVLLGRSPVPVRVAHKMNRPALLVDDHAHVHEVGQNSLWRPSRALDIWGTTRPASAAYVHMPTPGVFDRCRWMYPGDVEPPANAIHWSAMTRRMFVAAIEDLISRWLPYIDDSGSIAIQSGIARLDNDRSGRHQPQSELQPRVRKIMNDLGWHRSRHHPLRFRPDDAPYSDPALNRQVLQIFKSKGK